MMLGRALGLFLVRRSPGSGSRPRWSWWQSADTCATASPNATSRNCAPTAGSRSTTLRSTGGCNGSPRLLADAAQYARRSPGDRWFVDETYVKVHGVWRCVYRAIDQHGQVIDVLLSARRDAAAAAGSSSGRCGR